MFDIGGWEFLIILVVAIVIIGPKDLPGLLRSVTGWISKARHLTNEFRESVEDLADEVEIEKINAEISSGVGLEGSENIGQTIHQELKDQIDPSGELAEVLEDAKGLVEENLIGVYKGTESKENIGESLNDIPENSGTDEEVTPSNKVFSERKKQVNTKDA